MKHKLLILLASLTVILTPGCVNPPKGTVFLDLNADGHPDALAFDENMDGIPDLDEAGLPKIVAGSDVYAKIEGLDEAGPNILLAIAPWLAGGTLGTAGIVLGALGGFWKSSRLGRMILNLVFSIQAARKALKEQGGGAAALSIVDNALAEAQLAETQKLVIAAKEVLKAEGKIESVTTPAPAPPA